MRSDLLDPVAIARLGSMGVRARHVALGALAGLHRSRRRGSSVEFSEHKEYVPGDDLRHIDWKALGKLDKYYVKRFEEETELRCYVVLDASGSMGYAREPAAGAPPISKLRYGTFVAAALVYLLLRQQDPVGLLFAGGTPGPGGAFIPPRAREGQLGHLLTALEQVQPHGPTDLATTLRHLTEIIRPRSLVVVLSDLFDRRLDEVVGLLRGLDARRHEVAVFHLLDPDELTFPFRELLRFRSMEGDTREVLCDTLAAHDAYLDALADFTAGTRRALQEGRVEYHLADTAAPIDQPLIDFLMARAGEGEPGTGRAMQAAARRPGR